MRLAHAFEVVEMTSILTAEDVVRRIAAECAFVDERGGVGIRLRPATAIVRQYRGTIPGAPPQANSSIAEDS